VSKPDIQEVKAEFDLSEKVFTNSPNMLVLCLTVIGLIKIYTRFEKITTFADNFLAFVAVGYFVATVFAYLALRSRERAKKLKLARIADILFLSSLCCTGAVALFMTFALAG
jgi:low temperature requirement protein LtrA